LGFITRTLRGFLRNRERRKKPFPNIDTKTYLVSYYRLEIKPSTFSADACGLFSMHHRHLKRVLFQLHFRNTIQYFFLNAEYKCRKSMKQLDGIPSGINLLIRRNPISLRSLFANQRVWFQWNLKFAVPSRRSGRGRCFFIYIVCFILWFHEHQPTRLSHNIYSDHVGATTRATVL
jgi:hypothetical protein